MAKSRWLSIDRRVFDPIVSLCEPDILTAQQYLRKWCGTGDLHQPEKRLMFAVLQEVVECFQEYAFPQGRREEELFKDAEDWILKDDHEWAFSFINICETLDMDPHYLRTGLLRWKEKTIRERSRPVAHYPQRKNGTNGLTDVRTSPLRPN
jgi:hypothetical protein